MLTAVNQESIPGVIPADKVAGPPQGKWTYSDYVNLPDDGHRYEIINGVLYMTPSPGELHQAANRWFIYYLTVYVQLIGLGRVYGPPFDVKLAKNKTVQPDVIVILTANQDKIKPEGIEGAPDLVVEISSPGTVGYDRREKQDAYAEAGVTEYWIADPASQTIEVMHLTDNRYQSQGVFQGKALLPTKIVPGLPVGVEQFFA